MMEQVQPGPHFMLFMMERVQPDPHFILLMKERVKPDPHFILLVMERVQLLWAATTRSVLQSSHLIVINTSHILNTDDYLVAAPLLPVFGVYVYFSVWQCFVA
jgi:hypothetical protein